LRTWENQFVRRNEKNFSEEMNCVLRYFMSSAI